MYKYIKIQSQAHLESSRISAVQLFCGNRQRIKAVGCFSRRALLQMFDSVLNATLPKNLFQPEDGLNRSFPPLGLHKGILGSRCLLIILIYTNNKKNSSTIQIRATRVINSWAVARKCCMMGCSHHATGFQSKL